MKTKSIIQISNIEAKKFFIDQKSYSTIKLPPYFVFKELLDTIDKAIEAASLNSLCIDKKNSPSCYNNVNYSLFTNKDGVYDWRHLQLIHPVLYVCLVNQLTEKTNWQFIQDRFKEFSVDQRIECCSLPTKRTNKTLEAAAINHGLEYIEEESLKLSLDYQYIFKTDITNCYDSLYTHSVDSALHGKETAKNNRNNNSQGGIIDKLLQSMSYGQTNGIPHGSYLMDFIAEIVLGYADLLLSEKLKKELNFKIMRHRDDYRIFVHAAHDGERIMQALSEVLATLGMRLNTKKTSSSNEIIANSIKPDKLYLIHEYNLRHHHNYQLKNAYYWKNQLLFMHGLSKKHPNSGSLRKELTKFSHLLKKKKNNIFLKRQLSLRNIEVITSILCDIAVKNPDIYPQFFTILSTLFTLLEEEQKLIIIQKIYKRFDNVPNKSYFEIWMQRAILKISNGQLGWSCELCNQVSSTSNITDNSKIWNSFWLKPEYRAILNEINIIDREEKDNISAEISSQETDIFSTYNSNIDDFDIIVDA